MEENWEGKAYSATGFKAVSLPVVRTVNFLIVSPASFRDRDLLKFLLDLEPLLLPDGAQVQQECYGKHLGHFDILSRVRYDHKFTLVNDFDTKFTFETKNFVNENWSAKHSFCQLNIGRKGRKLVRLLLGPKNFCPQTVLK